MHKSCYSPMRCLSELALQVPSPRLFLVTDAFTFVLGGRMLVKWNENVSLEVIPAEYVLTLPHGNVASNVNALAGFTFPVGRKK